LQQAVIELPVAVRTQPDQIVQGIDNSDRGVQGKGRQRSLVGYFDVLVITAANTPIRTRGEVLATGMLAKPSKATSRVIGIIRDGPNWL